jgi:predicted RNA-binding Zn ribbon-like protein
VAVKLVNTLSWRFDTARRTERLPDAESLLLWSLAVGVVTPAEAEVLAARGAGALDAEAARARDLREAAFAAVLAHVEDRPPPAAATGVVHRAYAAAVTAARPSGTLPLTWDVALSGEQPERAVGHRLALAAAGLLASDELALVGRCANEPCGWLFVDLTRSHTRRWCSSEGCGNSVRARRHYARHRDRAESRGHHQARRVPGDTSA